MAEIEGKKISGVPERTELTGNELYPFADSGSQGHVKGSVLKGYCATPIGEEEGTAFDGARGKAVENKLSEGFIINHYLDNNLSNGNEIVLTRIGVSGENGEKYSAQDTIPSATTTKAGVMSANDKKNLDKVAGLYYIPYNISEEESVQKIKDVAGEKRSVYICYSPDGPALGHAFKNKNVYGHVGGGITMASESEIGIYAYAIPNLDNFYEHYDASIFLNAGGDGTKFLSDDGTYKQIDIPDTSSLATKDELSTKQDVLVSGTNIKTVNGQSILGGGNITIEVPEGGITDAPSDGSTYGRNNGAWIKVEMPDVSEFITETEADGKYATPALVDSKVAALVNSAPTTLDTLKELADALGNDANFSTTITTKLGEKVDKTTYESDKAGFATKTELANKLDTSTYNSDKSGFATKTELNNKKNITIVQEVADASSSASFNLDPNTLKKMGEVGTITVLGFTTTGLQSNELAEYAFEFKSGDTPTVLTMPESVKWIGDHTIEANKTYQVSIVNNLAVMGGA